MLALGVVARPAKRCAYTDKRWQRFTERAASVHPASSRGCEGERAACCAHAVRGLIQPQPAQVAHDDVERTRQGVGSRGLAERAASFVEAPEAPLRPRQRPLRYRLVVGGERQWNLVLRGAHRTAQRSKRAGTVASARACTGPAAPWPPGKRTRGSGQPRVLHACSRRQRDAHRMGNTSGLHGSTGAGLVQHICSGASTARAACWTPAGAQERLHGERVASRACIIIYHHDRPSFPSLLPRWGHDMHARCSVAGRCAPAAAGTTKATHFLGLTCAQVWSGITAPDGPKKRACKGSIGCMPGSSERAFSNSSWATQEPSSRALPSTPELGRWLLVCGVAQHVKSNNCWQHETQAGTPASVTMPSAVNGAHAFRCWRHAHACRRPLGL